MVDGFVAAAVKELEPLLQDAKPFFGGSDKITLAEVLTGSFIIRLLSLANAGVYPASLLSGLEEKTPKFLAWAQDRSRPP